MSRKWASKRRDNWVILNIEQQLFFHMKLSALALIWKVRLENEANCIKQRTIHISHLPSYICKHSPCYCMQTFIALTDRKSTWTQVCMHSTCLSCSWLVTFSPLLHFTLVLNGWYQRKEVAYSHFSSYMNSSISLACTFTFLLMWGGPVGQQKHYPNQPHPFMMPLSTPPLPFKEGQL